MKRFLSLVILAAALAFQEDVHAAGLISAVQIVKTNTSASSPVALAAVHTYASKITVIGNRTARTANTGDVYIGPTSGNDTQSIKVGSGEQITINAPAGEWIDLTEWYLDVTTVNDGVLIIYSQ